jgi:starvation-inducible DNA-binding protein
MSTHLAGTEAPDIDEFAVQALLASDEHKQVSDHLQATLADLIEITLFAKHLQWNVASSDFRFLQVLEEFVETWRRLSDAVAQRASAVGARPDGQAATVAASTEHKTLGAGALSDDELVYHLTERLMALVSRMRERLQALGALDPVSRDLLGQVVGKLQMQLWTVRVQTD